VDTNEDLIDDMESGFRKESVNVSDAPIGRVLDRQHGKIHLTITDRFDHVLKSAAGYRLGTRPGLAAGLV